MGPIVSIVIPVYNGASFIRQAVDSVIAQTYANWELLIVDDGSTDGSSEICDECSACDARIKVFHQPNGGVNSARQKGVDNASGDWLLFVDADDTIPEKSVETYIKVASGEEDIVVSGYDECILNKADYIIKLLSGKIMPGPVLKLFRNSLFRKYAPHLGREIVMGEDLLINLVVSLHVSTVRCIPDRLYDINCSNSDSVTRTFRKTWQYEKLYFKLMEELFVQKCTDLSIYDEIVLLVNKSKLNGIKYVMLSGNRIDYRDAEFVSLKRYFRKRWNLLGQSEKLIFLVPSSRIYRFILGTHMKRRR